MIIGALFSILEIKTKNVDSLPIKAEQLIYLPRRTPEENLMIGLIKEFANLQNVTQITACLPIPKAVRESVPWGILTTNLSNKEPKNDGTHCEQVPIVKWQERIDYVRKQWKTPGSRTNCKKLLNYVFVQIVFPSIGWCAYDEPAKKNVTRTIIK